jgi:energy-coupling factor transporter transmembrane protein EcfT
MGPSIFILSGIISLAIIGAFLFILDFAARETFRKSLWILFASIAGIFVMVNLLYFYNIIPPLPLALKDADIYHSLAVNAPGQYIVTEEPQNAWWNFLNTYQPVHISTGTSLFAYTAVFSPAAFNLDVIHEWQHYDPTKHAWVTVSQVSLAVTGGRDGGYRTFSKETLAAAGKWRVNVKTTSGAIIGRVNFEVILTSSTPALQTTNID